jgi:TRAP-type mannitol/chloroaromatic compound transport system permease small subunit
LFMRVIRKIDDGIGRISHILMLGSGILILLMAWIESYGVVKRYIFHNPDPAAYELSTMFLLFCGVLAVAGVERLDRHVRNDLIASRFPERVKIIVIQTIFPLMALIFCVVLTWKSVDNALYALDIGQTTKTSWALPLAPIKFVIPFGYTLLCLVLVSKLCRGINNIVNMVKGARIKTRTRTQTQTKEQKELGF